jgi:hypothetical protein
LADNVDITAGTGTTIATDDSGTGHVQVVKLAYGANGDRTQVPADGDGLLVNLGANNDVTVSGTVTAELSATDNAVLDAIETNTAATLTDAELRATPVEVTGTEVTTSATFDSALDVCQLALAGRTSVGFAIGGSGSFAGTVTATGTIDGGVTSYIVYFATQALVAGLPAGSGGTVVTSLVFTGVTAYARGSLIIEPGTTHVTLILNPYTSGSTEVVLSASMADPLRARFDVVNGALAGVPNTFALVGGSDGTNLRVSKVDTSGRQEVIGGAAHDVAVVGNPVVVAGRSSLAAPTDVVGDGRVVSAWHLRNGAAATVITAAGALIGGDATNGLDVDVTRLPALAAGTNNIGDVDVLTVPADPFGLNADAASATGSVSAKLRFIAATGIPITALPASTNTIEMVGDVAHDVAVAGNPVLNAGVSIDMDDTAPPNRASAESRTTRIGTDRDGGLFVHPHGPQIWSYHVNGSSALTDAVVHASPGAGLSLYVTDIVVSSGAATAMNVFFEEGASTVLGPYYLEAVAGRGLHIKFQTPKKITAATALTVTTSAAIAHSIDVTGFVAAG